MSEIVVLVAGNAGHGKDSFAEFLREAISERCSVRVDAYAWALKQCVHLKTGIPMAILMATKEIKESFIDPLTKRTVRKLLQDEGEDTRQRYGHLVWAWGTAERARVATDRVTIVTDARHPKEEVHWMKQRCSEFARVFSVRVVRSSVPVIRGHPSEDFIADEPDSSFDFIIRNDSSLDDLRRSAAELSRAILTNEEGT